MWTELVQRFDSTQSGIKRLYAEFETKFADEGYMNFMEFAASRTQSEISPSLAPENFWVAAGLVRESRKRIKTYLEVLNDVDSNKNANRIRSVIVEAAQAEYKKLTDCVGDAVKISEEYLGNWTPNI